MQFESPLVLLFLLALPTLVYLRVRKGPGAGVKFSSLSGMKRSPSSVRVRLRWLLFAGRLLCLALLIIALARPRKGTQISNISTHGVAMVVVVDRSSSMQAEMSYDGVTMNRLEAVKLVLKEFIGGGGEFEGRSSDMIGLITFARYADTICPLIHGHNVLLEFLKKTELVTIRSEDGTAIGDAVALAAARLKTAEDGIAERNAKLRAEEKKDKKDFQIKSKVIVLLTDGQNNAGEHSPMSAAEKAKEWGIKIYTIGIGSGQSFMTVQGLFGTQRIPTGRDLDERLLKGMAEVTGGFYARAGSGEELSKIYQEIDKLEKTEVESIEYTEYAERFGGWAMAGLCVLGLEILAAGTVFRKIP